jgi:hypothetical protein
VYYYCAWYYCTQHDCSLQQPCMHHPLHCGSLSWMFRCSIVMTTPVGWGYPGSPGPPRHQGIGQFSTSYCYAISAAYIASITGTDRVYQFGTMSEIRCSTELPVQSIQWLDESSTVVREGTSVRELVLVITIAASHNNSRYTCRVRHGGFMESKEITIRAGRKI